MKNVDWVQLLYLFPARNILHLHNTYNTTLTSNSTSKGKTSSRENPMSWNLNYIKSLLAAKIVRSAIFRLKKPNFIPEPMEPLEEFEWTLRSVRKVFKLISIDIFQPDYRRGATYYILLLSSLFLNICYISSIFDQQRDFSARLSAGGLVFGAIQVDFKSNL